jgi:hypothetical protein
VKVPKKIQSVIGLVQRQKKIPGFIYNLPEDLRKEIIVSQKQSIVINASDVNSKTSIVNSVCSALKISAGQSSLAMLKIEDKIGKNILIINSVEYLAPNAYAQIKEFSKSKIPVILLSSHQGFADRFRDTKFYKENNFFDCNYNEVN